MATANTSNNDNPAAVRKHVLIMTLVFVGFASLCAAISTVAIYQIATGETGYIVMLTVFGTGALVTGFLGQQYLRDVSAETIVREGQIWKKWHRSNLFFFFMPSFYLNVEGKVYSVRRRDYGGLLEEDTVRITCYPHSMTVEKIERYDNGLKEYIPAASGNTI